MNFREGKTVGIDLGTSNSAIASLDLEGHPTIVKNARGNPITPSIVTLGDHGRVLVGDPNLATASPDRVVSAVKRQMGKRDFTIDFEGKELTPEFISALILRKLRQDAEESLGFIGNAVISVPYYFNDPCRKATIAAGEIAGLNVLDIINEPTAATLAYAWLTGDLGRASALSAEKTILVYDLGGGTFDVTVVRYTPTDFSVVGTDGDTFLGGIDWTRRLAAHLQTRFVDEHGYDPCSDAAAALKFERMCEQAKCNLTEDESVRVKVPIDEDGFLRVIVSREEFESVTADLLRRTRDTTELVLEQAGVNASSLHEVILVGGSTFMPAVRDMLTEMTGFRPSTRIDPQRAVAQGAAVHAAILEARHVKNSTMSESVMARLNAIHAEDVNAHSLGVVLTDPRDPGQFYNHIMIPRNTRLPAETIQRFVTTMGNPAGIRVKLLEGEAPDVRACTYIGSVRISDLPENLPAGSPVQVAYSYDLQRHIRVHAKELTGSREAGVHIVWEAGLTGSAIDSFRELAESYRVY